MKEHDDISDGHHERIITEKDGVKVTNNKVLPVHSGAYKVDLAPR